MEPSPDPTPRSGLDLPDALFALSEVGAEYVVVGALALDAYGISCAGPVEVFVRPSPDNAIRVVRALRVLDIDLDQHGITHYDFAHPGAVFDLRAREQRLVLVTSMSGVDFDEAWDTRAIIAEEAPDVWVLGAAALATHLRAAGREGEAHALEQLERGGP